MKRALIILALLGATPIAAEDAAVTVDGTATVNDSAEIVQGLLRVLSSAGAPDGTDTKSLILWGLTVLLGAAMVVLGYYAHKTKNRWLIFGSDVVTAVRITYIKRIKPHVEEHGSKPSANTMLQWGMETFKIIMSRESAQILKEKGEDWVRAQLHAAANRIMGKEKE